MGSPHGGVKFNTADPEVSGLLDNVIVVPLIANTVGLTLPPGPPLPTRTPDPLTCDTTNPTCISSACA